MVSDVFRDARSRPPLITVLDTGPMEETTIATPFGLLRVVVQCRGDQWVARLVGDDDDRLTVPPAIASDREGAVRTLSRSVRFLGGGAPVVAPRPGSWESCP